MDTDMDNTKIKYWSFCVGFQESPVLPPKPRNFN